MSQSSSTKAISPVISELSESDSYPYAISGNSLNVLNRDTTNPLIVTVTHSDETTTSITVPVGYTWDDFLVPFYKLETSGATTYLVQVKRTVR